MIRHITNITYLFWMLSDFHECVKDLYAYNESKRILSLGLFTNSLITKSHINHIFLSTIWWMKLIQYLYVHICFHDYYVCFVIAYPKIYTYISGKMCKQKTDNVLLSGFQPNNFDKTRVILINIFWNK